MRLPNADKAMVDDRKLLRYILNPLHPHGRSHALLFDRLLGINLTNADVLRTALLEAAANGEAVPGQSGRHGEKFEIRFSMNGPRGVYTVLSVWLIDSTDLIPRLITAYVE